MNGLSRHIANSSFQEEQYQEQERFAKASVRSPQQYDEPPDSVEIISYADYQRRYGALPPEIDQAKDVLIYHVGMNYIRSDPYTGMAALYHYLYTGENGLTQVLHFANIPSADWYNQNTSSKTYRMFKEFCDGILFEDGFVLQNNL